MPLGSFTTLFDSGTQDKASELSQLGDQLALAIASKAQYDSLTERTEAARAKGIEPPGDVMRARQALYDNWMSLNRTVNAARTALVPAIREAARRNSLTSDQMNALADAGVLPRVGGQVIIPSGLGVISLLVWGVIVIAGAALAGYTIERVLVHIRAGREQAVQLQIAKDTATSVDAQWTANMEAQRKAAIAAGAPVPPMIPHPNATNNPAGTPSAMANAGGGGSGIFSGLLAGIGGGTGTAFAIGVAAWFLFKKKRK